MTYSRDFREKVLKTREEEDLTIQEVSCRFGVDKSTIQHQLIKIEAKTKRHKPATKIDMDALRRDVEKYPDAYRRERAEKGFG